MTTITNDLANGDYHNHQAIGSTGLKLLQRSPAHYYAHFVDPNREPREQTPAQLLGSAVHMAVLETHNFDETYTVLPDGIDRRTKEGKALYAEIMESGKTPLVEPMFNKISDMMNAAYRHPLTQKLSKIALAEHSIFWVDELTGAQCKIRPDWHVPPCAEYPNGLIVDLKTVGDASAVVFAKNAWNSDMHIQAALYVSGFYAQYGTRPDFLWYAIETDKPHANAYHKCPQFLLEYGTEIVGELLEIYAQCVKTNHWPSYGEDVTELELPNYAMRVIEGIEETEVSYV